MARNDGNDSQPIQGVVTPTISRHSAQTTARAKSNVGTHARKRQRENHAHMPVITFVLMAFLGFVLVWFVGARVIDFVDDEPEVEPGIEVTISIPEGAGGGEISEILVGAGIVPDSATFLREVKNQEAESSMKSGSYTFLTGANVKEVVRQLVEGPNSMADVITIPEGFTVKQIAAAAEEQLGISAEDFLNRAKASTYINDFPFLSEAVDDSLEGFLFPKTYDLGGKPKDADTLIRMMLNQYAEEIASLDFSGARDQILNTYGIEMSDYEFIVMASIIEKEAVSGDDWVNVSSVFYNRIMSWMPLQSDATMGYVVEGEVTPEDLETESPYNTYLNYGLTPTPICNPGAQSIEAALHPATTDYYYFFIIDNDQYQNHTFSTNYDDHMAVIEQALADQAAIAEQAGQAEAGTDSSE